MEDERGFHAEDGEAEPSAPLFSIFRPRPKPAASPAPKPVPAPQKIEPPETGLKDRMEKLAGEMAALSARLDAAGKTALTREEAGRLRKLCGRIGELERKLAGMTAGPPAAPDAGLPVRVEKLAGEIAALSARVDAAAGSGFTRTEAAGLLDPLREELAAERQKSQKRLEDLEGGLAEVSARPDSGAGIRLEELAAEITALHARVDAAAWSRTGDFQRAQRHMDELERRLGAGPDAGLAGRVEELAGKIAALFAGLDAAAWSRNEEGQKSHARLDALERSLARLSAQYSRLGLEGRVDKLAAEITALHARVDAASWARAGELRKSYDRIEALERECGRLSARQDKDDSSGKAS